LKRVRFIFFLVGILFFGSVSKAFATPQKTTETKPEVSGGISKASPEVELNPEAFEEENPATPGRLRFDLTDCVRMALRNNTEIRGADFDLEASKYKLKEAKAAGVPVFDYQYEAAPVPTDASQAIESFFSGDITMLNRAQIGVGIPLATFGKLQLAQSLARGGIDAAKEQKNQKTGDVVLKVKQLYNGILLAREIKTMLQDAIEKIDHEIAKRESSTEPTDPVDLAKLKLSRYELLKRFGEVTKKEELAVEGLKLQSGIDRSVPFEIKDRHLRPVEFELNELSFYIDESKRYRPESRLLDIAIKAKEDEYQLEKRKLAPDLGLGGFFAIGRTVTEVRNVGATNDFNDPFNYTRAGVGIRLKGEFNWRQATARIHEKEAEYYKVSLTKDYAEEGLNLDVRDAYLSVKETKADLENFEKAYRLARQLVFLTKSNYDVGVGDKKDYGDSLQGFLLTKGRYYEAIFNYNVAVATLINKVGYQAQP
jgi:outer membrane protein